MECTLYMEIKFSCRKRVMQQFINIQCDSAKNCECWSLFIRYFVIIPITMIDNALFPIHFFWRGGRGIFREALELSGYSHI